MYKSFSSAARVAVSFCFLFITYTIHSQDIPERRQVVFGQLDTQDKAVTSFEGDPEAAAIVLYEKAEVTFDMYKNQLQLFKKVHRRIKVLDVSKYENSEIFIPYYKTDSSQEEVDDIEAITFSGGDVSYLEPSNIYTNQDAEKWFTKRFPIPGLQDGSIVEYRYTIRSPFLFNVGDWNFQEDDPKLYSEYEIFIPGNVTYRRALYGTQKLDVNFSGVKRRCLEVAGFDKDADCDHSIYVMKNIPSYKDEAFTLASKNYKSRISFELQKLLRFDGVVVEYTEDWESVDRKFRKNKAIGRQLAKSGFFEEVLPKEIAEQPNTLEKAKQIYHHIKAHLNWNNEYRIFSEIDAKRAYKEKKGNVAEINIALINTLKEQGFDAQLVLSSTRNNGLVTKVYPIMSEYNYVLAALRLDGKTYLLDATDKYLNFDQLPKRALNRYGRLMDFENGSSWIDINSTASNGVLSVTDIVVAQGGALLIKTKERRMGYVAYAGRKMGVNAMEATLPDAAYDIAIEQIEDVTKPVVVSYALDIEAEEIGNSTYITPFLTVQSELKTFFKEEKRQQSVDLGYPVAENFIVNITIPEGYIIEEVPKSASYALPAIKGTLLNNYALQGNTLKCVVMISAKNTSILAKDYPALKTFFDTYRAVLDQTIIKLVPVQE